MDSSIQSNRTFHYGFYCVAFLDILGQRRKLRQLPRLPRDDAETRKFLAETAGYVLRLRRHLSECFEQFAKPTQFLSALPVDAQNRIMSAKSAVKYRGFSDSFIIAVSCKGDDEQCGPTIGVFGCIAACCILHLQALAYKRPIRGGIDVGLALDLDEHEVYGPVLESAHYLESRVADYPRIVVGDELSKYLDDIEKSPIATPLGRLARSLATRCKQYITLDSDGSRMLDFLGVEMAKLSTPELRKGLFGRASEYMSEQKQIAQAQGDEKHLSRYTRLGNYFDKQSALWA